MRKIFFAVLFFVFTAGIANAQIKILFDATKAETAGNADWTVDADLYNLGYSTGPAVVGGGNEANPQRVSTPAVVLGHTYAETYWSGGLSNWGLDCVQKGYAVETLPVGGAITYSNVLNAEDLSKYNAFVVCEPNILFTAAEKTAILSFVSNGGGLFMISDHDVSDRNNDGYDSPQIWDDLMQVNSTGNTNPFGITFNRGGPPVSLDNFSETSTNVNPALSALDSILHGPMGPVTEVKWSNGTSMTLSPTANASVKAIIYKTSVSPATGNAGVMVATCRYGAGKVVAIGDSSPCDDGTGDPNDGLYNGYTGDVPPNHRNLLMNGTIWLVTRVSVVPVTLVSFSGTGAAGNVLLSWTAENEAGISGYRVQRSINGTDFYDIGTAVNVKNGGAANQYDLTDNFSAGGTVFYRLDIINVDGTDRYSDVISVNMNTDAPYVLLRNNPVTNKMNLVTNVAAATRMDVSIYNEGGQQAAKESFFISAGKNTIVADVSRLPAGVYFVKCSSNSFTKTLRLVKIY